MNKCSYVWYNIGMGIYLDNGYLNMSGIIEAPYTFNFITGARGIGKTYGTIEYCLEHNIAFVYMRRTQQQIDLISNDDFNPFKPFEDRYNIMIKRIQKGIFGAYLDDSPMPFCYLLALSTIANLRGFSLTSVQIIIYDEFIAEAHVRPIREEGKAFLNAYETINRNRELQGLQPIRVYCLANSEELANPLYIELKLVTIAEKMTRKGITKQPIPERDLCLYNLSNSRISEQKKHTALYKLAGSDSSFSEMALSNEFVGASFTNISSEDLRYYDIVVVIGELAIYHHKSADKIYICSHIKGSCEVFDASEIEQKRFRRKYAWIWFAYLRNEIYFESYIHQVLFEKYYNM